MVSVALVFDSGPFVANPYHTSIRHTRMDCQCQQCRPVALYPISEVPDDAVSVTGQLELTDGRTLWIVEGAHADNLPTDLDAAKADIAERVRRHCAEMYDDPDAVWRELRVLEADGISIDDVPPPVHAALFAALTNNDPRSNQ